MAGIREATVKATFTFDEATARRLNDASVRLSRPKSEIVREAIGEFHARLDRLTEGERNSMLHAFDTLIPAIPNRARADAERELRAVRQARRAASKRGPAR